MKRNRLGAEERRQSIVQVAFRLLADKGFEGLRTRDVAAKAKINIATLHHYFPGKEDLVAAVADHLETTFSTDKARPRAAGPREKLRGEIDDLRRYAKERPDLLTVYAELSMRAARDPRIRTHVDRLNSRWVASVERILREGVDAKVFRSDLDPRAMARVIVGALWGMGTLLQIEGAALSRARTAIEALVSTLEA